MRIDLEFYRRMFAEEIEAVANIRTSALVDAIAAIPRERFLNQGPWIVRADVDLFAAPRQTPDDDPRRVYHNYAIAIDPERQLFNGSPALLASFIDRLGLQAGSRVLHVGTGLGYYTALLAHMVGPTGRVLGIEVDEALAAKARANLASMTAVEVRTDDASGALDETFDAILINAGVTHVRQAWFDALAGGGRLLFPLTASFPAGGNIGKGLQVLLTKVSASSADAAVVSFVSIYSAIGLRDESLNVAIGAAMAKSPWPRLTRYRTDAHDMQASCWLHTPEWCLDSLPR